MSGDRYVHFVPLAYQLSDDENYVVGPQNGSGFVELPEFGALIVRALQLGNTIDETAAMLAVDLGAEVDVDEFVAQLRDRGWVADVSHEPPAHPVSPSLDHPSRFVKALFSRPAWFAYAACAVFNVVAIASGWTAIPSVVHLMELTTPAAFTLLIMTMLLATLIVHEGWHYLGGRAAGIRPSFSVGRRWVFLVAQTDLSRLWMLPRSARYGPCLAGMAIDCVMVAGLLLLSAFVDLGRTAELVVGATLLALISGIGFQFQVYLRTDVYAVLVNALDCRNLGGTAGAWWRAKTRRASLEDTNTLTHAHPNDHRALPWFLATLAVGIAWTSWSVVNIFVPEVVTSLAWVAQELVAHDSAWTVIQALLLGALVATQLGMLVFMIVRDRIRSFRQARARRATIPVSLAAQADDQQLAA